MKYIRSAIPGICAGSVTGLFGSGGGMILVPLLRRIHKDDEVFAESLFIMIPICFVALLSDPGTIPTACRYGWPMFTGSAIGGITASILRNKVPADWLHRIFGLLLLWSGIRRLWYT